ncbi:MAG: 16S rRNA (guanine(527)-N(7))-methyltransferase RsmG [Syntrophomonadaceae bacterium]|jgi:16S rRNA (guanine527-N7)-methyltransferase
MEITVKRFKELVLSENEKQNLISRKSVHYELDKHIEDSSRILDIISFTNHKVVDLGSGAGFPGLILAIFCREANFTLVESDQKKSQFLKNAIQELGLSHVEVICARAEVLGQDKVFREQFDYCTSRAVAAMNILLEYSLPLVKMGGQVLMWKGSNYQREIEESRHALQQLGGTMGEVYLYNLLEERDRAIVIVDKTSATPAKYPRRVGIPSKRPL